MLVQRKKKQKKSSQGSGRHISDESYAELYRSYAETKDIKQAAKDAGVTVAIARKYIEKGTDTMPAISDRLEILNNRAIGHLEAELLQTKQNAMDVVSSISEKLLDSMKSVEIVLSSSRLYDEEGNERLASNGKPLVPLDANGVRSVLQAARDITELLGSLSGGKNIHGGDNSGHTVNVGVVLSPDGVRSAASKVMRGILSNPTSREAGTIEGQFQEVVTGEAVRRVSEADDSE